MDAQRADSLISQYRDGLLNDTLPFWIDHGVDHECGGFMISLDRDGSVLDTDKAMWQQCRFTWLLATLYNTVERRGEWLSLAKHGIDFIRRHGFDKDGRLFFHLTREGKALRKRRYVFTESFAAIAFAAYARAAGDDQAARQARDLFDLVVCHFNIPSMSEPKFIPDVRPSKTLGPLLITIGMAQVLRETLGESGYDKWIDRAVREIENDFLHPELEAVLETAGPKGEVIDHFDGRMLNPGHAIEAAWFILHEAKHRGNDSRLIGVGTKMLDWTWKRGWDPEAGGIFTFVDLKGLPVAECWHDMKFWWPHTEAIIATLLAYQLTGDEKYAQWHERVHEWAYSHFPDPEHGEWFGYLHRDGTVSSRLKGNLWKGPFHVPRMQWYCWKLLEATQGG